MTDSSRIDSIIDRIRSRAQRDDGAVAILVVLVMTALLALAALTVDAGAFYSERRQMQTAADAAALAGVQELPNAPASAESMAEQYALTNSPDVDVVNATIGATFVSDDTITVELTNSDMGLSFARFLGRETTRVRAKAKAVVGSPTTYGRGVMPFGIMARGSTAPPYGLGGSDVELHTDPQNNSQGNFHTVELDKTSGYSNANNIQGVVGGGGTTAPMSIGDVLRTEPGNAANPEYNALKGYFTCNHTRADLNASYDSEKGVYTLTDADGAPCRRIITCPVIIVEGGSYDWDSLNGRAGNVVVVGFAQYFVESVPEKGTLVGQFVQVIDPDALDGGGYVDWAGVLYWLDE